MKIEIKLEFEVLRNQDIELVPLEAHSQVIDMVALITQRLKNLDGSLYLCEHREIKATLNGFSGAAEMKCTVDP